MLDPENLMFQKGVARHFPGAGGDDLIGRRGFTVKDDDGGHDRLSRQLVGNAVGRGLTDATGRQQDLFDHAQRCDLSGHRFDW